MFKHIMKINLEIVSLYAKDYSSQYSMKEITDLLKINYSNAFKRIKELVDANILTEKKVGSSNSISINVNNKEAINLLGFVEQSSNPHNSDINDISKEITMIDPFSCIGLFGSRVSGKATKNSDWDVFVITSEKNEIEKIMSKFPFMSNIQLQIFDKDEFWQSLISTEETVVKHIIKNKKIIYNPYPFYNLIQKWEMTRYAPSR